MAKKGGLIKFVRHYWDVLEPERKLVDGWPLEAICLHLEAITFGETNRLLANVPPGFMKSLLTNVFWPAWEWGPMNKPHHRYVAFSYAAQLTERDNAKFRDLISSQKYQTDWKDRFSLTEDGKIKVSNDKTGWKLASSVGGVGTGERGDRVICDDLHNVKEAESELVRTGTVTWFRESLQNRLNDLKESAIVVIMQRVHEADVSGEILSARLPYTHLMVPMEYDPGRHCQTEIGWSDPRTEDGELAWPERFADDDLDAFRTRPFMWAGQYQQMPEVRGGSIFKRDWWQLWGNPDDDADPAYRTFPIFDFIVAYLDGAYTEKEENDPSALTVWGVFQDKFGNPRAMLVDAWEERLALHALVEKSVKTCRLRKVDLLLIENKASGISVSQEMKRLHSMEDFAVQLDEPKGDKVARAHSVTHLFSEGMVYAPDRAYADKVIDNMAIFPRGAHDDLTDSAVGALRYLRRNGLLTRNDEREYDLRNSMTYRKPAARLYPV